MAVKVAAFLLFLLVPFGKFAHAQEGKAALIRAGGYAAVGCIKGLFSKQKLKGCAKEMAKNSVPAALDTAGLALIARGHYWPGFMVHSAGISAQENITEGRRMFSSYRIYYLWGSFGYDFEKKDFRPQLLLGKSIATIRIAAMPNTTFDFKESLRLGVPFFETDHNLSDGRAAGITMSGVIAVRNKYYRPQPGSGVPIYFPEFLKRHELVHAFQYRRGGICNSVIDRKVFGENHRNFPVAFGQDICLYALSLGPDGLSVNELEARALNPTILKSVVEKLRITPGDRYVRLKPAANGKIDNYPDAPSAVLMNNQKN